MRPDDFEFPTLEKLEQGSQNIEPIAALVSAWPDLSQSKPGGTQARPHESWPDPQSRGN